MIGHTWPANTKNEQTYIITPKKGLQMIIRRNLRDAKLCAAGLPEDWTVTGLIMRQGDDRGAVVQDPNGRYHLFSDRKSIADITAIMNYYYTLRKKGVTLEYIKKSSNLYPRK